jgi:hypothetical protein
MRLVARLILVLVAGGSFASAGEIRYGHVYQPAGSRTIYFDVQYWWRDHFSIDFGRWRWKHTGMLAIDTTTLQPRFIRDNPISHWRAYDANGRSYRNEYLEHPDGYRDALYLTEPGKEERRIHVAKGTIHNVTPAPDVDDPYVFFLRQAHHRKKSDPSAVVRLHVKTGKTVEFPLPMPRCTFDWLTAADRDQVYLCGRSGRLRTWRGDFRKKNWDAPLDGYFQPLDAKGTLVARRDYVSGLSADREETTVRVIRDGKAEEVELGRRGRVFAVFGTDLLVVPGGAKEPPLIHALKTGKQLHLPREPRVEPKLCEK